MGKGTGVMIWVSEASKHALDQNLAADFINLIASHSLI